MDASQKEDLNNDTHIKKSTPTSKRKTEFLDDDFFSLSNSFSDKPKKRKKHKTNQVVESNQIKNDDKTSIDHSLITKPIMDTVLNESTQKTGNIAKQNITKPQVSIPSLSPPPVDKQKIRKEIELKINAELDSKQMTPLLSDSEEDEDNLLLQQILNQQSARKTSSEIELDPKIYNFDEESEKKRKYIARVTSKLPVPSGETFQVDFGVKGLKKFDKILKSAVDYFRTKFSDKLSETHLSRYNFDDNELIWCEGRILIQRYFTPKTLRIPPCQGTFDATIDDIEAMQPPLLNFYLIPSDIKNSFKNVFPELQTSMQILENFVEDKDEFEETYESSQSEEEYDNEIDKCDSKEINVIDVDAEGEDEFFKIGLKGKDNKRIDVKVSPKTKLMNLLVHYLKVKSIDQSLIVEKKIKMIFDDEEMDLNDTVGDTELEEDFEIQIVL